MNSNSPGGNGKNALSSGLHEPELNYTKTTIQRKLVFIELKEEVRERLGVPPLVPIFQQDLAQEIAGGQIAPAALAAGMEADKLLRPGLTAYDRYLARYYLLEGQRALQAAEQDDFQAQRNFQKALDLNQADLSAEAAFYLAALASAEDPEQAIQYYRLSVELNPQTAAPHFELGRLLRERRDLPGALAEFEMAFRLEPHSANLLNEVGDTHLLADDLSKARAAYQRAAELEPEQWVLPVKQGLAEYHLGQFPAAIRSLRDGLDLAPDALEEGYTQNIYIEGLFYLGLAYREIGRPDQARKLFKAVLQFNPHHAGALEGLS